MKNIIIAILLLAVIGCVRTERSEVVSTTTSDNGQGGIAETPPANTTEPGDAAAPQTVEITMKAGNYYLDPNEIRVKQGDIVIIHFTVESGRHGFGIEGYDASTDAIDAGGSATVTFVADKKGTFPFYCNVPCGSGHRSMRGQLIVE